MSAVDFKVSITVQKALISADLNSSLMMQLIFGIYTAALCPAIYVHIRKENRASPQSIIIAGIMIVLYCMTAFVVAVSWYYTSIQFCKQATRGAIFSSADSGIPVPVLILIDLSQNIGFLMADGLLVWRCYHACGGSFRSNILSMGLFIVEITLVVASAIFDCLLYLRPELETHQLILVSDYLDGASFISVAATSLVATFMICYQIYSRTTPGSGARRLYRHIVDALIQSSCVYTVTVILLAIVDFLVNSPNFRVNADILEAYSSALGFTITGLAPTLMIARLATGSTHYGAETASSTSFTSAINGEPCDSYRSDSGNPQSTHKEATQTTKHTRGEGDQLEGDEIMVLTRHTEEPGSVSEGSSV